MQQRTKLFQRQRVRTIGKRLRGIIVHFQEQSIHARGRAGARQRLDKFRLAAAGISLSPPGSCTEWVTSKTTG